MKRRSNKISMNFYIIGLLILIIILMGMYIFGRNNQKPIQTTQTEIITPAIVDSYDYYNFMPRRLFRNFYENDYYEYREKPIVIQDTKPIYINVPSQPTAPPMSQPAQQNNLNLFNYPPPKSTETFQTNVPMAPSISPPPLSAVSPDTQDTSIDV